MMRLYSSFYILCVALLTIASLFLPEDQVVPGAISIQDAGKVTLDYIAELTKMLMAINTAMITAAAAMATRGKEWSASWGRAESIMTLSVFIFGGVAYYSAYIQHVAILEMVPHGMFSMEGIKLRTAMYGQYLGVIFGLFALGLVFCRLLEGRRGTPSE